MNVHGLIIDVSSYQHPDNAPISWKHVKKSGVIGVVVKATQMGPKGERYVNPWFERDMAGASKVGLPVIAYHFASLGTDHNHPYNAVAEAEFFRQTAGADKARIVDVETATNREWVNEFLSHLDGDNFYKCVYGCQALMDSGLIYGRLWVAAYPGPVHHCAMHQFTDKGRVPGIYSNVDLSRWIKERSGFTALFGKKPPHQIRNFLRKLKP